MTAQTTLFLSASVSRENIEKTQACEHRKASCNWQND